MADLHRSVGKVVDMVRTYEHTVSQLSSRLQTGLIAPFSIIISGNNSVIIEGRQPTAGFVVHMTYVLQSMAWGHLAILP